MKYILLSAMALTIGCDSDSGNSQVLIDSGDYVLNDFYIPSTDDIPVGGKYSQLLATAEASGDTVTIEILEAIGSVLALPFNIDSSAGEFGVGSADDPAAELTTMSLAEKAESEWEVACDSKLTSLALQSFTFADGSLDLGLFSLEDPLLYANVEADDCLSDVGESVGEVAIKEGNKDEGYILYMSISE